MKNELKNPIKVLFIDPAGNLWGSERSLLLLLKHLDRKKVEPYLCLPPNSKLSEVAREIKVPCAPYFASNLHTKGPFSKAVALLGLLWAAYKIKPDVIHLNQAGAVLYAELAARIFKVALIVHVRMEEDCDFISKRLRFISNPKFIAISAFIVKELHRYGVNSESIQLIYNPIESNKPSMKYESFYDIGIKLPESSVKIGFSGRLCATKGINLFIEAMQFVIAERPSSIGVVFGESAETTSEGLDYLSAMKNFSKELGIADRIMFLGFREDVQLLMQFLDVFVSSSDTEAWGRSICDALVAGVPVVATDVGGVSDVIRNGVTGYLVPPRNSNALSDAIIQIIEDPAKGRLMAKTGKEWILDHCNPKKHAKIITECYEKLYC